VSICASVGLDKVRVVKGMVVVAVCSAGIRRRPR
jgi:hypothetical protein